nr:uncharacterized protein LOC105484582 isoform X3 [Macaca nemestrina]
MLSDSHWESICTDLLNAWYVQEEGIQWSCKTCLRTGPGATPWHTLRLSLGPAITELRTWMQLNKENLCDSLVLTTPWNASTAPGPPFCPKRKPASSLRAPTTAAPIIVTTSDPPSKGIRCSTLRSSRPSDLLLAWTRLCSGVTLPQHAT